MVDLTQTVEAEPGLMDTDELLQHAIDIKAAAKRLEASLAAIQDELTKRVESGDLDPAFSHNDWSFTWIVGRRSWKYPAAVTGLEAQLRQAKRASEADGSALPTTGAPYWTIREPRP
jgi:Skp family chaperone for outer membrane proteins